MKLKHLFALLIALPLIFGLSSCAQTEEEVTWSNYVTYNGYKDGFASVTWQGVNDAEPITLYMDAIIPSSIPVGSRLYISFLLDPLATLTDNMHITPSQIYVIPTIMSDFSYDVLPPDGWSEQPELYATVLFRSGEFLNMEALLPNGSTSDNMKMQFLIDKETLNSENVVAYLSYTNAAAVMGAVLNINYMCSIDISQIMRDNAKTLTIYMNNSNRSLDSGWDPSLVQVAPDAKSITIPLK